MPRTKKQEAALRELGGAKLPVKLNAIVGKNLVGDGYAVRRGRGFLLAEKGEAWLREERRVRYVAEIGRQACWKVEAGADGVTIGSRWVPNEKRPEWELVRRSLAWMEALGRFAEDDYYSDEAGYKPIRYFRHVIEARIVGVDPWTDGPRPSEEEAYWIREADATLAILENAGDVVEEAKRTGGSVLVDFSVGTPEPGKIVERRRRAREEAENADGIVDLDTYREAAG